MIATNAVMERSFAVQKPHGLPASDDRVKFVQSRLPMDLRIGDWIQRWIIAVPHIFPRTAYFIFWCYSHMYAFYEKAREFVCVITSEDVTDDVWQERMDICSGCKAHKDGHCMVCGCWHWRIAELRYKNRKARHRCPLKVHPGTYPVYPSRRRGGSSGGGCGGRSHGQ